MLNFERLHRVRGHEHGVDMSAIQLNRPPYLSQKHEGKNHAHDQIGPEYM